MALRPLSIHVLCGLFMAAITVPAQAEHVIESSILPGGATAINLSPGGSLSALGPDGFTAVQTVHWSGTEAEFEVTGETFGGFAPGAYVNVEGTLLQKNRAGFLAASGTAKFTYYIEVVGPENIPSIPVSVQGFVSRMGAGTAGTNSGGPSIGVGSLDITRVRTGLKVVEYDTNSDFRYDTPGEFDDGSPLQFDDAFHSAPGDAYQVELFAFAQAAVGCCASGPEYSRAEVFIDPVFSFDQAAYDAMRLLDPNLPDVQLHDAFVFHISPNVLAPVPVPAAALMLGSALPLLAVATLRRRRT